MNSFIELLLTQFKEHPHNTSIIFRDEKYSFSQLYKKAKNVGALLQAKGLKKGDRVVLYTPDKFSFLIMHLGIIISGGVSLPLNFSFTKDEMIYFLNDSEAKFVFASGDQAMLVKSISNKCSSLKDIISLHEALDESTSQPFDELTIEPNDNCFMLYSSGTTGTPKGVVHTHHNLGASLLSLQKCWQFSKDDILFNALPLFHIHGLSFATHLSLISGSSMMLEEKIHPKKSLDRIGQATVFMAVPTIYYSFLRRPEFKEKAKTWTKTRLFTCGSAPIRSEVLPELEEILGSPLINRYGMTESHVITSLPLEGPFVQGSVGKPLDGVDLKLVTDNGKEIHSTEISKENIGIVGEVKMRSENLFSSYWRKPEATAKDYDTENFYSTGDLGKFDENGFLILVGRKKDLIITSGYNVYPPVVEKIINNFSQVKESAVIGLPDNNKGEQVVAVIVTEGNLDLEALKKHCQERLVNYQTPTRFEVVESLPRNTMGKVLKRVLKENYS